MQLRAPAILIAARPHGETAVIARMLTEAHGVVVAHVAGGRGRQLRPVVIPGNIVEAVLRVGGPQRPVGVAVDNLGDRLMVHMPQDRLRILAQHHATRHHGPDMPV